MTDEQTIEELERDLEFARSKLKSAIDGLATTAAVGKARHEYEQARKRVARAKRALRKAQGKVPPRRIEWHPRLEGDRDQGKYQTTTDRHRLIPRGA